jgi:hypothetical protein
MSIKQRVLKSSVVSIFLCPILSLWQLFDLIINWVIDFFGFTSVPSLMSIKQMVVKILHGQYILKSSLTLDLFLNLKISRGYRLFWTYQCTKFDVGFHDIERTVYSYVQCKLTLDLLTWKSLNFSCNTLFYRLKYGVILCHPKKYKCDVNAQMSQNTQA